MTVSRVDLSSGLMEVSDKSFTSDGAAKTCAVIASALEAIAVCGEYAGFPQSAVIFDASVFQQFDNAFVMAGFLRLNLKMLSQWIDPKQNDEVPLVKSLSLTQDLAKGVAKDGVKAIKHIGFVVNAIAITQVFGFTIFPGVGILVTSIWTIYTVVDCCKAYDEGGSKNYLRVLRSTVKLAARTFPAHTPAAVALKLAGNALHWHLYSPKTDAEDRFTFVEE
jgi:hypothetical protein